MNKKAKSTLEKMEKILSFENYAPTTIKTYCGYVEKFLLSFDRDAYHIPVKEAEKYLLSFPYSSRSQQNQIISNETFLKTSLPC